MQRVQLRQSHVRPLTPSSPGYLGIKGIKELGIKGIKELSIKGIKELGIKSIKELGIKG